MSKQRNNIARPFAKHDASHIGAHPFSRRDALRIFAGSLSVAAFSSGALSACGNYGNYDENEISKRAQDYYADKYGDTVTVVDISEATDSGLFGTYSLENYFCTMSDGNIVLYDQKSDTLKDNRQTNEIVPIYINYLREFEQNAAQKFIDAGYEASFCVDDIDSLSDEEITQRISYENWETSKSDFSGSYFHTKLEAQEESFIFEEQPHASIGFDCFAYISGADAQYADSFPTDVPETPAWQPIANAIAEELARVFTIYSSLEVYQAPGGDPTHKETQLGQRYLSSERTLWAIYDYVYYGEGMWITADERGFRLTKSDLVINDASDTITLEDVLKIENLPTEFTSSAYKSFTLAFPEDAISRAKAAFKEDGYGERDWISLNFAFDAADITYSDEELQKALDNSPEIKESRRGTIKLYAAEKQAQSQTNSSTTANTADSKTDEATEESYYLSTITYNDELLPNGMITGTKGVDLYDGLLIVRI